MSEPVITPDVVASHGLKPEEYDLILEILGREPTFTELGIFSVMWSEHCSYKNSKPLLSLFTTTGPDVLQGPGENAGVVAFGDNLAVCFKMESHNHPSAVEPYQGAATGVGGILRDIFTMGARPVALVDCLFFGEPGTPTVDRVIQGVVHGIADYGNCVGVPTVAGQVTFASPFAGNPLVNVMAVGVMRREDLTLAQARTPGSPVVYYGNATGRDGVHGATFASVELTEETMEQRSAVQVGDPFMGKKILEATLELIRSGTVEAIQDMGAAGLTCSGCEIAGRGCLGMELDLDAVPQRAKNMSPYEMMLSESQERMLAIIPPEHLDKALAILEKWEVSPAIVGRVTEDGLLTVYHKGDACAKVPALKISNESPVYDREARRPESFPSEPWAPSGGWLGELDMEEALLGLLAHPTIASKNWIHEQYDTMVQTNTVIGPGAGAAVLRVDGSSHLLAIGTGVDPLKVACDPYLGGQAAVAEAALNLWCVGARPLGLTDNLNFGNPEKPEQFWYFKRAVEGIAEAAKALKIPVTGGNVSLYNENPTGPIWPTPTIGMVGSIEIEERLIQPGFKGAGERIYLLGTPAENLSGSWLAWLKEARLPAPWTPPEHLQRRVVELQALMQDLVEAQVISSAQDVSEGGVAVALAESLIFASEPLGASIFLEEVDTALLFGEPGALLHVSVPERRHAQFEEILQEHEAVDITELGVVTEQPVLAARVASDSGPGKVLDIPVWKLAKARAAEPYAG